MPLKYKYKHPRKTTRGCYRKYTTEQIEKLFDLIIDEGYNAKDAALLTGIKVQTAQYYLKMYNNDAERSLPGTYNKPRGRPPSKLNESHSDFLGRGVFWGYTQSFNFAVAALRFSTDLFFFTDCIVDIRSACFD
ncbi:hypothetical protein BC941DRAFT_193741 [Chlamydoabsidia padenii]|nr:hypothetical protein BC941DRAFT_193741 [Chlamydoabsidia padenii]